MVVFQSKKDDTKFYTSVTNEENERQLYPVFLKENSRRQWFEAKNGSRYAKVDDLKAIVSKNGVTYFKEM